MAGHRRGGRSMIMCWSFLFARLRLKLLPAMAYHGLTATGETSNLEWEIRFVNLFSQF